MIEAGDWAAVGATAALLAAASDSQSQSSRSRVSLGRVLEDNSSVEAARAAELDQLVESGDWEGVVQAAARFEALETSTAGASSKGTSSADSASGTGTGGSPSLSTSLSESPSKMARRAEVRAEVEALVRRVVPEEIDNVDEMMNQFKGREDELVETLRTMQERAIALKARTAGQKMAKVEARRTVQRGVVPGTSKVAKGGAAGSAASKRDDPSQASSRDSSIGLDTEMRQRRAVLENAIEAGDWEAVGEAAALMSDASVTTFDTERHSASVDASSFDVISQRSRMSLSAVDTDRAAAIDALIDRGDWTGVMAAASQFSRGDKTKTSPSKEEVDALAQAELWMKIAEQKKASGANVQGASDATDWAIQRSLSKMKESDKKKKEKGSDEDEV